MKNWLKALVLTSFFYLFILSLLFNARLPEQEEPKHTPMALSLFQEPQAQKQPTPKNNTQTLTKMPKKKQTEKAFGANTRRDVYKSDINTSIMSREADSLPQESIVPSLSTINSLFTPPKQSSAPNKELRNLYGDTLRDLTPEQVEYLDENLNRIGWITQKYLEFPTLAGQLAMQGEAILEFDLFPNGDISPIKLLKSSGYALLDDNAVETVEVAYKEYPHPKEKTKIRLLVKYIIEY